MSSEQDRSIPFNGSEEIIRYIEGLKEQENPLLKKKLIPREELSDLGEFLQRRGIRKSFTTGVYDMIHIGHSRYLWLARQIAGEFGVLVVGLNSDNSVKGLKGPTRPILPEMQRAEMLSFLQFVDYITIFDEPTGAEIINLLKPDAYLCVEGSWEGDIAAKKEVRTILDLGGNAYYAPRQEPSLSTSAIITRIEESRDAYILNQLQRTMRGEKS